MSDIHPSSGPLASEFAASHYEFGEGHFMAAQALACDPAAQADQEDRDVEPENWSKEDVEAAFANGFSDGLVEGQKISAEALEQREKLNRALQSLCRVENTQLADLLWQTIHKLLRQAVGEVTIDRELFQSRCIDAVAAIDEMTGNKILYVSSADLEILKDWQNDVEIEADENLLPGSVRLLHRNGEIKSGSNSLIEKIDQHVAFMGGDDAAI